MDLLSSEISGGEGFNAFIHGSGIDGSPKKVNRGKYKIINTKVPVQVVYQLNLFCVMKNRFKKEVFNEMTEDFLVKHLDKKIEMTKMIGETEIDMNHLETTNFEIDQELLIELKKLKIENRCSLRDIYTQIIICYFNDNKIDVNKK